MSRQPQTSGNLALNEKKVIVIEAAPKPEAAKLRVAAYCRVSSDSTDQLNSFVAQLNYTDKRKILPISSSLICRISFKGISVAGNGRKKIKQLYFFTYDLLNVCFDFVCSAVDDGINLLTEDAKVVVVFCAQFSLNKFP